MTQKKLRFALFGNEYQSRKSACIAQVLRALQAHGAQVQVEEQYFSFLQGLGVDLSGVAETFVGAGFEADYVLSLGGDGTLLTAASWVGPKQTPIVGVNMGRLGFLADVRADDFEAVLSDIYASRARIESHAAIQIETAGEPIEGIPYALNDIAVLKRDHASMITIRASVDGRHLATYQADGLIVSTPTGSTAYNLSNGGPIIAPDTQNLCLTPVAPHSLSIRPIVLSDESVIDLEVESRSHSFLVGIDGRNERLHEGTHIRIRKAPFPIRIVTRGTHQYYETLREKLAWGANSF